MLRRSGGLNDEEANTAAWEAARGALTGAAKWGLGAAILGVAGYAMSPIYRGLTIQFKVYLQMSGMLMGGMIEADRRIRDYEAAVRVLRRKRIDRATWERNEKEFDETPSSSPGR